MCRLEPIARRAPSSCPSRPRPQRASAARQRSAPAPHARRVGATSAALVGPCVPSDRAERVIKLPRSRESTPVAVTPPSTPLGPFRKKSSQVRKRISSQWIGPFHVHVQYVRESRKTNANMRQSLVVQLVSWCGFMVSTFKIVQCTAIWRVSRGQPIARAPSPYAATAVPAAFEASEGRAERGEQRGAPKQGAERARSERGAYAGTWLCACRLSCSRILVYGHAPSVTRER